MGVRWPTRSLVDLVENFDAKRVPIKESDRRAGPYPYYGASGIVDYVDGYIFDGDYLLIAEDGENLRTRQTPIAFMARGRFWVNNHAHIVQGNEYSDTRYLMYALQVADVASYLTGSTMPKLTQRNMNRIPVSVPTVEEQRAIANILGSLDDKIELNRKMNETLEAMAQAIFKSWFVDFDPVRAKAEGRKPAGMDAATAALFPDSFQDSSLGKVPKRWKKSTIGDLCRVKGGFAYKSEDFCEQGYPVIKIKNINSNRTVNVDDVEHISEELALKTHDFILSDGDLIMAMTGATIGKFGIVVNEDKLPAVLNQRVAKFFPLEEHGSVTWFVYCLLRSGEILDQIINISGGSAQANVSAEGIMSPKLFLPEASLIKLFNIEVDSLFRTLINNLKQIRYLEASRDALLPKLLSGEIRVNDKENLVIEV